MILIKLFDWFAVWKFQTLACCCYLWLSIAFAYFVLFLFIKLQIDKLFSQSTTETVILIMLFIYCIDIIPIRLLTIHWYSDENLTFGLLITYLSYKNNFFYNNKLMTYASNNYNLNYLQYVYNKIQYYKYCGNCLIYSRDDFSGF